MWTACNIYGGSVGTSKPSAAGDPIKTAKDLKPVPEPMLPDNYEGKSVCMRGTSFRDIVVEQSVRCCGCA